MPMIHHPPGFSPINAGPNGSGPNGSGPNWARGDTLFAVLIATLATIGSVGGLIGFVILWLPATSRTLGAGAAAIPFLSLLLIALVIGSAAVAVLIVPRLLRSESRAYLWLGVGAFVLTAFAGTTLLAFGGYGVAIAALLVLIGTFGTYRGSRGRW
ncbi:MAG: hypothetical protein SFX74_11390 [Fimbriimonadaceae bacterium]|nr:hypothetical protein [Fimbriimonadaceae bacterium]